MTDNNALEESAIILFTRTPVAGEVKTRLSPCLSSAERAQLQAAFIKDIVNVSLSSGFKLYVYHAPTKDISLLTECLPNGLQTAPQTGESMGERMFNAFSEVLKKHTKCILVGSDIPRLKTEFITAAFAKLSDHDMVIGPADDGGYYLLGLKKAERALFSLECYGSDNVLHLTLEAAKSLGLSSAAMETCSDVDVEEDLRKLADDIKKGLVCAPETSKFLKSSGWI